LTLSILILRWGGGFGISLELPLGQMRAKKRIKYSVKVANRAFINSDSTFSDMRAADSVFF